MKVDVVDFKALMVSIYKDAIPEQQNPYFKEYLEAGIANDAIVDRQIRAFELIAPWLKPGMSVLEWGLSSGLHVLPAPSR